MKKQTRIILIVVIVLVIAITVLAVLNAESAMQKQDAEVSGTFKIITDDTEETVDFAQLLEIGITNINAELKTDGKAAIEKAYLGVPFAKVLEAAGITADGKSAAIFYAVDGYASALTLDEAMDANNVYIVTHEGDTPLGTKSEGGMGPFMMVVAKDTFSQRWCKYLSEVEIK